MMVCKLGMLHTIKESMVYRTSQQSAHTQHVFSKYDVSGQDGLKDSVTQSRPNSPETEMFQMISEDKQKSSSTGSYTCTHTHTAETELARRLSASIRVSTCPEMRLNWLSNKGENCIWMYSKQGRQCPELRHSERSPDPAELAQFGLYSQSSRKLKKRIDSSERAWQEDRHVLEFY